MTATFKCEDGPYDGRVFTYRDPLPDMIVIADAQLHYHEYVRATGQRNRQNYDKDQRRRVIYRWERSYRIPEAECDVHENRTDGEHSSTSSSSSSRRSRVRNTFDAVAVHDGSTVTAQLFEALCEENAALRCRLDELEAAVKQA